MKKRIVFTLVLLLTLLIPISVSANSSFEENGWHTDDNDFTGWVLEEDGISATDVNGKRVWKELTNTNDFTATIVIEVNSSSRAWVKISGNEFEINPQGGNGNQVFLKYFDGSDWINLDWLDALECKLNLTAVRAEGGDLTYTITGEGNDTPLELTLASRETDAKGIEFKVDGTAKCISLTMDCAESENPEDPTDPTDPEDPDREKTPLELAGWTNVDEGYDFTGWSIDENGNISGVNGAVYRIQNELITNQNDFTITANYQLEDEASVFFKVISLEFELDARHSSSEQVYVKGIANGDWLDAEGFAGTISITRVDGGEITLTVTGNGNETVLSGTREASKASSYLELGFYAGKGTISDLKVECKEGSTDPVDPEEPEESPLAEDGWTVEADGNADLVEGDFSGWEIIDDKLNSIKGKWMDMENIIIAKRLLTDVDNFSLQLILDTDFFSSPCIEILGIRLELDGNHGDGNQVFVKKDSVGAGGEDSWFACEDDIVYVNLSRKDGGKLQLTLWGEGNPTPIELAWDVAEETDVVKLIVFRGEASFLNISVGDPDKEHIKPDLSNVEPEEPEDPIDPEDPKDPTEPKETKKKGCNSSINQTTFLMFTIFSFVLIAFYVIRRKKATK